MKAFVVWLALAVSLVGCDSAFGTIARFEVRDWNPDFRGDFSNGDSVVAGQRITSARVVQVDDDWPGLFCEHLRPAPDDTDFLRCARLYERKGSDWVVVDEPPGRTRFLGQDVDGARYWVEQRTLWSKRRGATDFEQLDFSAYGEAFMHAFGIVGFTDGQSPWSPQAIEAVRLFSGNLRTYRNGQVTGPFSTRLLDAEGNFYVLGKDGLDRVSADGMKTDAAWFTWPTSNQVFDVIGVGRDGRLYALSTAKTNLTGADARKDNDIPLEAIMSLGHGESEWLQASEPFSTPESRAIGYGLSKPYGAFQGRDDSWWIAKCTANCDPNGANNSAQSYVWQWRKPGKAKSAPIDLTWTVWRGSSVRVELPRHGDLQTWSLGSAPAGIALVEGGLTYAVLGASSSMPLGTHAVTVTNPGGQAQTLQLEVKDGPGLSLEPPRRLTLTKFSVVSAGDRTVWLDEAGVVRWLDVNGMPGVVPGLPAVQSVEGEFAHAVDGRVFLISSSANSQTVVEARELRLPRIHSMHYGAGLTADGKVVFLLDDAQPIDGLTDIISLSSHQTSDVSQAGRLTWALRALDRNGVEYEVVHKQTFLMPMVNRIPETRAISRVGHGALGIATDGRFLAGLTLLGTGPVKTFDSVTRYAGTQTNGDTFLATFGLAVTQAGEAWVDLTPLALPPGRKAVSMTVGGQGQYVWLDDGSILDVPSPALTGGEMSRPVTLTGVATPSP